MTALFVASAGGHLTELLMLQPRLEPPATDPLWVSDDDLHARTALAGQPVVYAHGPTRRNMGNAVRNYRLADRLLREHDIEYVVSTGAALAVPVLLAARRRDVPAHYIECWTRVDSPSMSGRILERFPGVFLYAQHAHWTRARWQHAGSVYDGFRVEEDPPRPVRRVVVVLGTQEFPFTALVERVAGLLRDGDEVTWQLGSTPAPAGLPGHVTERIATDQMADLVRAADVVVGHAGTGVVLTCLSLGVVPVICPRRAAGGEHVDDHQAAIARALDERGLAIVRHPEALTRSDLEVAAGRHASAAAAGPFRLSSP